MTRRARPVPAPNLKRRCRLMLAYAAGLRAGEVMALTPADIDSACGVLRIRQAKGKKDLETLLSAKLLKWLRHSYANHLLEGGVEIHYT